MTESLPLRKIKKLYPDEWVLLGNPEFDQSNLNIISGVPIFHSKDKKEVCYVGKDKTPGFNKITLIFTGALKPARKITGIFNRL